MLADIMEAETGTADTLFLLALISFALAFIIRLVVVVTKRPMAVALDGVLMALGAGFVAFGLMAL